MISEKKVITVSLKEINESFEAIDFIKNMEFDNLNPCPKKYPNFNASKISYDIKKRLKIILPEMELIQEEARAAVKKYSEGKIKKVTQRTANGNFENVDMPDLTFEEQEKCNQQINSFLKKTIDLPFEKLKYSDFGRSFKPIFLYQLDYLIDNSMEESEEVEIEKISNQPKLDND